MILKVEENAKREFNAKGIQNFEIKPKGLVKKTQKMKRDSG